jgi:hypothetical protein
MLTDFFISGRSAGPAGPSAGDGLRSASILARLTRFDRRSRGAAPIAADAPPPDALSAASEAERLKRLRASFEDDLAHFLRGASSAAAE